jgi:hypothetical protein
MSPYTYSTHDSEVTHPLVFLFLFFQAAKDTRHMMGPAATEITLIHFNDVYNVDSREQEPVGGAPRFCTALKSYAHLNPIILFSGDAFAPSISESIQSIFHLGAVSTCVMTCDSVPALACQRKRVPCPGASHANAGTESQVELQVMTQVNTDLYRL